MGYAGAGLLCLALFFPSLHANAQNLIANPGFENNPPAGFGNHIGYPITPWTLGSGNTSNVVKVDGGVSFNYGNSGPRLDADPATGAGVQQHYLDIASGANDFYQSFTVPVCGGSLPGEIRQATFSGWFSTRDNLSAATATISIRQGTGTTGTVLATASASLPAPVPPQTSATAPWVQVSGSVDIPAGTTISYVVAMDNNANFDEASLSFSSNQCVPAQLTLVKAWSNAVVGDDATVTIARAGTVIDTLLSDAGTANEIDTDSTPVTVYGGEALVLAETLAGSNVGQYSGVPTCTGGGVLSGSTLTVGSSGAPIVCRYTNTRRAADLRIEKSSTEPEVESGDVVTYTIAVANDGPEPADGARVTDPAPVGLDCSAGTLTCGGESGGAVCPASPTVADLQGAGVVVPTLPAGGSLQFVLTCTVTASGIP